MSINLSNLELTVLEKISSASTPLEVQTYSKALQVLRNGNVYSLDTFSSLPTASEGAGKLYYIQDEKIVYFAPPSYGEWIPITTTSVSQIFGGGSDYAGGLGKGTSGVDVLCSFTQEICSATDWVCVTSGTIAGAHAIKADGSLWAWGYNAYGNLGIGCTQDRCSPVQEFTSSTWCHVMKSAVYEAGGGIKTDSTLWTWGNNQNGWLGDGTVVTRCSPVQEASSSTWIDLSGGSCFMNAIKTDGTLWSWGCNTNGDLGNGTVVGSSSPVQERSSNTSWCKVRSGFNFALAIKSDGTLWSWGNANNGKLACYTTNRSSPVRENSSSTNWAYLGSGRETAYGIKNDGTLWGWGCNTNGQIADNTTVNRSSPVQEASSSTNWCYLNNVPGYRIGSAVKTDGTLWGWGRDYNSYYPWPAPSSSPSQEVTSGTNWSQVAAGTSQVFALKATSF